MNIRVSDYEIINKEVFYTISVEPITSGDTFQLKKTYKELRALNRDLEKTVAGILPTFPPRKCCGSKNPDFLSRRKALLHEYLRTLPKFTRVKKSKHFIEFFSK